MCKLSTCTVVNDPYQSFSSTLAKEPCKAFINIIEETQDQPSVFTLAEEPCQSSTCEAVIDELVEEELCQPSVCTAIEKSYISVATIDMSLESSIISTNAESIPAEDQVDFLESSFLTLEESEYLEDVELETIIDNVQSIPFYESLNCQSNNVQSTTENIRYKYKKSISDTSLNYYKRMKSEGVFSYETYLSYILLWDPLWLDKSFSKKKQHYF